MAGNGSWFLLGYRGGDPGRVSADGKSLFKVSAAVFGLEMRAPFHHILADMSHQVTALGFRHARDGESRCQCVANVL